MSLKIKGYGNWDVRFIDLNGEPQQWSHTLNDSMFIFVFLRE